jgi:hypothetical protein
MQNICADKHTEVRTGLSYDSRTSQEFHADLFAQFTHLNDRSNLVSKKVKKRIDY